jgi:DHA1 family multidrug resistance protein-like MFS transporter
MMNTVNHKNLFILSFTLLVVTLGYSLAMPLLPFYIERFGVGGTELGWLMATYSLMQLICAPIWGIASDRYGRKPILAIGVLGYTITLFMFGIAQSFVMMFIARSLSGILSSATMPTAMAYIGDNTPQKEKGKGMGQLGAMSGIGIVLGPLMGGLLSKDSLSLPFFVGSGLAFIALLLVIFLLPESKPASSLTVDLPLPNEPISTPRPESTDPKKQHVLDIYLRVLLGPAGILLLLIFIMSFGMTNFQGMIGLYVVDKLGFDTTQVGSLWMVMGAMLILVQGALVGVLTEKFGDLNLIKAGLIGGAFGFMLVAFAWNYVTTLFAMGIFILAIALIGPALNSYISNFAGEHQGTVMGLNSAFTSLGKVLGPLWGGYIYDLNIEYPFYSGTVTLLIGLVVSLIGIKKQASESPIPAKIE